MGKDEPGKTEIVRAPERIETSSALITDDVLTDTAEERANGTGDDLFGNRVSFADAGQYAFSTAELTDKEEEAETARTNLIGFMQWENRQSVSDAQNAKRDHEKHYSQKMKPAIETAREKYKFALFAEARYLAAYSGMGIQQANTSVRDIYDISQRIGPEYQKKINKFSSEAAKNSSHQRNAAYRKVFVEPRQNFWHMRHGTAINEALKASKAVSDANKEWEKMLAEYHEGVYKVRARNYDRHFQNYYVLSRGVQNLGDSFLRPTDAGYDEAHHKDVAKNIVEYTGVYDGNALTSFKQNVSGYPNNQYDIGIVAGKTAKQGSNNTMDGLMKHHTMVTMEAFGLDKNGSRSIESLGDEQAEEVRPPRLRMKVDSTFQGYTARHQIDEEGHLFDITALGQAQQQGVRGRFQKTASLPDKNSRLGLLRLGLVADEAGKNGEFLFSQKSAHIYSVPGGRGSGVRRGFFMGGEFIPGSYVPAGSEGASKTTSLGNMASREKLRTAIRRSDYFRHVNAATINYYMNYDGDADHMSVQKVGRSLMAKRAGLFSKTTLEQSWLDGTIQELAGGIVSMGFDLGTFKAKAEEDEVKKKDAEALGVYSLYSDVVNSALDLHEQIENPKDAAAFEIAYGAMTAAPMALTAVINSADIATGGVFSIFIGTLVKMGKSIADIVNVIGDYHKKTKNVSGKEVAYKVIVKISDFLGAALTFIDSTMKTFGAVTSALGSVIGALDILKDSLSLVRNVITGIISGRKIHNLRKFDKALETAMSDPLDAVGEAARKNSQVRMAALEARRKERGELSDSITGGIADSLSIVGTVSGTWSPIGAPFTLASKATKFIGMAIKKGMKIGSQVSDIGTFLGEKSLITTRGFDEVLKEETGINNKHYLPDLTKIFTAIDSHVLITKGQTKEERDLGKVVCALLTGDDSNTPIDYAKVLTAVGAPSDWRSVLLESIAEPVEASKKTKKSDDKAQDANSDVEGDEEKVDVGVVVGKGGKSVDAGVDEGEESVGNPSGTIVFGDKDDVERSKSPVAGSTTGPIIAPEKKEDDEVEEEASKLSGGKSYHSRLLRGES